MALDLSATATSDEEQRIVYKRQHYKLSTLIPHPPSSKASAVSLPSLFEAVEGSNKNDPSQRLAFTTEELELIPSSNPDGRSDNHRVSLAKDSSSKGLVKVKRLMKPGYMASISSDMATDSVGGLSMQAPRAQGGKASTQQGSVPGHPGVTGANRDNITPPRARPTVTTILRQQHVLQRVEKKEQDKVDSLMVTNGGLVDVDHVNNEYERREQEGVKVAETRRLLQAKLAYERAIAASRKVADEKQKIAGDTRLKEKEWQQKLAKQREVDKERRKTMTEALQKAAEDSKRAFDEMLRSKQLKASRVKEETEQLQAEAKERQKEEELRRQDKIQQIQAAKLALKRTKEKQSSNPNQFYRTIAVPETQIKLRLQKEEEERKLQETRRKIQKEKQLKSVKLIKAMKKIQSHEQLAQIQKGMSVRVPSNLSSVPNQSAERGRSRSMNSSVGSNIMPTGGGKFLNHAKSKAKAASSSAEDIDELMQEWKQLRSENLQKRMREDQKRTAQIMNTASTQQAHFGIAVSSNFSNNAKIGNNSASQPVYRSPNKIITVGVGKK